MVSKKNINKRRRRRNINKLFLCSLIVILILGIRTVYKSTISFASSLYNEYSFELDNEKIEESRQKYLEKTDVKEKIEEDIVEAKNENSEVVLNASNLDVKEVQPVVEATEVKQQIKKESKTQDNKETSYRKNVDVVHAFTDEDVLLLARLIYSEAGNQTYNGKVAVGNVVRYRMKKMNKSLSDVIYQKGQFDGVKTKYFNMTPSEECIKASYDVLINNYIVIDEAYFYVNLDICKKPNWAKDSKFIMKIGNHWFYRY